MVGVPWCITGYERERESCCAEWSCSSYKEGVLLRRVVPVLPEGERESCCEEWSPFSLRIKRETSAQSGLLSP